MTLDRLFCQWGLQANTMRVSSIMICDGVPPCFRQTYMFDMCSIWVGLGFGIQPEAVTTDLDLKPGHRNTLPDSFPREALRSDSVNTSDHAY